MQTAADLPDLTDRELWAVKKALVRLLVPPFGETDLGRQLQTALKSGTWIDFVTYTSPRFGGVAAMALDLYLVAVTEDRSIHRDRGEIQVTRSARRKLRAWLEACRTSRPILRVIEGGR